MTHNRVERTALRTNHAFIVVLDLIAFALADPIGKWIVLFVAVVLALGTAFPPASLFKQAYLRILKPAGWLKPDVVEDDPNAHLFAQGMGAVFLFLSFLAFVLGGAVAGWVLAWIVIALAAVNLVFGFCAGCFVYFQLGRAGLLHLRAARR